MLCTSQKIIFRNKAPVTKHVAGLRYASENNNTGGRVKRECTYDAQDVKTKNNDEKCLK